MYLFCLFVVVFFLLFFYKWADLLIIVVILLKFIWSLRTIICLRQGGMTLWYSYLQVLITATLSIIFKFLYFLFNLLDLYLCVKKKKIFLQHLLLSTLSSNRVSAQSLGLMCISYSVDLMPSSITTLEPFFPFITASDPKLRSSVSKVKIKTILLYKICALYSCIDILVGWY